MKQIHLVEMQMANTKSEQARSGKDLPYHRIVAKFGTSLLTGGSDHLNQEIVSRLVAQVARLHKQGLELLVVSSGAIAAGRHKLGLTRERRDIPFKQVLASVGQSRLLKVY